MLFLSASRRSRYFGGVMLLALAMVLLHSALPPVHVAAETSVEPSKPLPDLSGLSWMTDDLFIAVHDAKNLDELDRPRVSLMALPTSLEGVIWRPADPTFPGEKSNDLESAARIPGTNQVLLVESVDNGGPFDRIFLAELTGQKISIRDETTWGTFTKAHNVEATAVSRFGQGRLIFVWAERNSGKSSTDLKWADLSVEPFRIGDRVSSVTFQLPEAAYDQNDKPLYSRPLVAMDVDSDGRIYIAATFDPEGMSKTPDNGPFRSIVYTIGNVRDGDIVLDAMPTVIGKMDGLKIESIAIREHDGVRQIFVGTDDENYGGILRLLPGNHMP